MGGFQGVERSAELVRTSEKRRAAIQLSRAAEQFLAAPSSDHLATELQRAIQRFNEVDRDT